ncbi:class III bacteriocin [Heyndrickxia sporothermodurans]|uniref:Uncharacterized protein n=1 Tax=Heyndrickxia sporothermodurans TaxID=46224 RepID=A0AB37HE52_9BACI|nr:helveticin J family class III bacteriocin [Heyndrickxia sporothermodurans]MBL5767064.1 hypothetical protein [Heyndrickxia sporothermodurans]MBL5770563.1 hypothetical protein [Heyndrickxia sporothermodurans]MBL5776076.1 hypothetical protein [Heyndrickxia sporothermodurans]MBL5777483.1 hypothetical protein [Heyndrickxia sporothermodurans]MBL5781110.1 hypothetical protein [Heyndrickxia sporothermodurans]
MKKIFYKGLVLSFIGILVFFISAKVSSAATTITTTIDRVFEYSGQKSNAAIQSFDYGENNEVFFTQRIAGDDPKIRDTTLLSRCTINNGKCTVKDYVKLKGFGHGESLEVIKENGKTYIWIGNGANSKDESRWSTDISLIEYKINTSKATGAEVLNVKTIKNLAKVAPEKSGTAYRSAVAIADGSDRICFRIQIGTSASNTYYAVYKLSEVTKALRASSTNSINIYDLNKLQLTHFTGVARPNNSFQGFDITGVGSGNKFLYIFGGAAGQTPTIYKYSYTNGGNFTHLKTIKIKGSYVGTLEAEGIKVEKDPNNSNKETIFMGLKPGLDDLGKQKPFRLYSYVE